VAINSLSVERSDLLIVVATGPRGSHRRRVSRHTARLQLSIGPYLILGRLHTAPGSDVMSSVEKREPMIPLTHATIAYEQTGAIVARDVPALIVNRMLVDWISPTTEASSVFPDVEVRSPFTASLLSNFSGSATTRV
jgi:hypothetical protein